MSGISETLKPDFAGKNRFTWWQGVVEDNMDPLKLGRVRVRIFGWHTADKTMIPTEDLPWASLIMPANSPSISGKGWSPNGLLPGCWVVGFFRDGDFAQDPVIFGSLPGLNPMDIEPATDASVPTEESFNQESSAEWKRGEMASRKAKAEAMKRANENDIEMRVTSVPKNPLLNTESGFYDPSGRYPMISRMGEPDTNRLARGDKDTLKNTIVEKKKSDIIPPVSTAIAGYWEEPVTAYKAVYPYNHVYESQSGHIVEYDDTPGGERIHWYHRSGTFNEVHPGGGEVHKIVGNSWDITLENKMIYVKGNASFNSDQTLKIMMGKDLDIEVGGDVKMFVKGNMSTEVFGNYLMKVRGFYTVAADMGMMLVSPRIDLNPLGVISAQIQTFIPLIRSMMSKVVQKFLGGGG